MIEILQALESIVFCDMGNAGYGTETRFNTAHISPISFLKLRLKLNDYLVDRSARIIRELPAAIRSVVW